jgi:hypothetical protein
VRLLMMLLLLMMLMVMLLLLLHCRRQHRWLAEAQACLRREQAHSL